MEDKYNEILNYIEMLTSRLSGKILLHNFQVPTYTEFGILENKQEFGFIEMVRTMNSNLQEYYRKNSQVFIFDFESFCSKLGKTQLMDFRMYYIGDIKLQFDLIPALCDEYLAYIKPIKNVLKKCIVLDLDNTLWGGIVGEDGFEGIRTRSYSRGATIF